MDIILLKSSACLLGFITFYKVFLESTSSHHFKRFYLLASVFVSIMIPFITFIEYKEPQTVFTNFTQNTSSLSETETLNITESTNYLAIILWSLYGLGVLLFTLRFAYNLIQIGLKIKKNPKQKTTGFINVLLQDLIVPHTFFSYIFLNKTKFENNDIPQEVLLHEEAHAKQKHSVDILFIELLQIIFWFHPLVYILKKTIKLNHEFLADKAVLNHGFSEKKYQNLLLEFSSNSNNIQLAHAINYSSIKKRFTVMKTQTSKPTIWLRSLLLLPLLAVLIYSFSTKEQIEKDTEVGYSNTSLKTLPTINDHEISCDNCKIGITENDLKTLELNTTTNEKVISFKIKFPQKPTLTIESNHLNENALNYLSDNKSLKDIQIFDIKTQKETLDSYILVTLKEAPSLLKPTLTINGITCDGCSLNLSKEAVQKLILGTTTNQNITSFFFKIKGESTEKIKSNKLNKKSKDLLKSINTGTIVQLFNIKTDTETFLPILITIVDKKDKNYSHSPKVKKGDISNIPPPTATKTQVAEYNKLALHYNNQPKDHFTIKLSDMKRLKVLYESMSDKQKNSAEPFPNFPPPPPPAPEAPKLINNNDLPPPPPLPENATPTQKKKYKKALKNYKQGNPGYTYKHKDKDGKQVDVTAITNESQIPPPPPNPLDHIIKMSKEGALFYYNGKSISSDEAIKITKKNMSINISSVRSSSKRPEVHLSTKPIIIED